jgi:hypothetical protein
MEYFLSHIVYIIIAALILAAVCVAWGFMMAKDNENKEQDSSDGWDCSMGCSGCSSFSSCGKSEKKGTAH